MKLGRDNAPSITSANAILMTRNKLFLRSLLLITKRTMVSKLPPIIKMDVNKKPLHHATDSALEGTNVDETVAFSELLLGVDVLFMFVF